MSERKNIDKLFQEKFKDFEMNPPENTWPELEKKLKKKKDRKAIPFWWRLSGIAAALVIGLLIGDGLGIFDNGNTNADGVVIQEKENKVSNDPVPSAADTHLMKPDDAVVQSPMDVDQKTAVVETSEKPSETGGENPKANSGNGNRKATRLNDYQKTDARKAVVGTNDWRESAEKQSSADGNDPDKTKARKKRSQDASTFVNNSAAVAGKHNRNPKNQKQPVGEKPDNGLPNPKNTIIDETTLENQATTGIATRAEGEQAGGNQNTTDAKSSEAAIKNESLNKNNTANPVAAAEEKNQQKKLDSTAIATVQPNALEELLNEKENKVTKEPKLNRWQITSNVAPIYFGSTSGGSPIDSTFSNKSKDYNTQVSYGIGLSYAINKRVTVRTGVNKVSLNYDTNDVELYAGLDQGGFGNLDSPSETGFMNFAKMVSASRANATNSRAESSLVVAGEIVTDKFTGSINQKMGYIEVPVEVSYAVIDKKFGVNVIAGVSTLFLNENEVTLSSEGYKTDLGEANNLNTTHFSTNVGLGVRYSFLKSFEAKFEPIFKYQLNTFSKDSGDFKPYFFGLYTGLSFRF